MIKWKYRRERDRNDKIIMIKWRIRTDNRIGESGATAISESLKTNTTLTTLDLTSDDKIEKEKEIKQMNKIWMKW